MLLGMFGLSGLAVMDRFACWEVDAPSSRGHIAVLTVRERF
jgi:hypothetical protein